MNTSRKISALSDAELYQKCKYYGSNARLWMRKFAGLLPEVYKRRLYKRRGCASIHEFAAKIAGMNADLVDRILNLSKKVEDKPTLKEQLASGSQGWSKIESVAYIATAKDEKFWADKVENLTRQALQAYVYEIRKIQTQNRQNGRINRLEFTAGGELNNEMQLPQATALPPSSYGIEHFPQIMNFAPTQEENFAFHVSNEVGCQLRLFKQTIEKERREALSWNEVIQELLGGYRLRMHGHPVETIEA